MQLCYTTVMNMIIVDSYLSWVHCVHSLRNVEMVDPWIIEHM